MVERKDNDVLEEQLKLETYLLLIIGVVDRPIPTNLHLQKEFFILKNTAPNLLRVIRFEKHIYGPYSDDLNEALKNPLIYSRAFEYTIEKLPYIGSTIAKITLTREGKKLFREIVNKYKESDIFNEFMAIAKAIRLLYDPLKIDELLLLVYSTFQEWTEYSTVYSKIIKKRRKIGYRLYKKGVISREKLDEITVLH